MSIENPHSTITSEPHYCTFDPKVIPYQYDVINGLWNEFDYSTGKHEVLLSGSVGSAKSVLMAHIVLRHCIKNPKAKVLIGRKALPDLKATIFSKILEHMEKDWIEGVDYKVNHTTASIRFANGSEIISRSWSDNRYKKMRSLELSAACIEELTENDDSAKEAYDEIAMRVGRIPGIKQNFIISATNPDSPSHWAYDYFINSDKPTRHVYYSVTTDNPFLPDWYIEQLKEDLDPKMARRMIYGEWIEIGKDVIYHAYNREKNYCNEPYQINKAHPVHISWDFNIGEGKPLSLCLFQHIDNHFHFFNEVVVQGARTLDSCEELSARGLLDLPVEYKIHGDATGAANTTKALHSDYDIIKKFFSNYKNIRYQLQVPRSNPPVRSRHNILNAYCENEAGQRRLTVYKDAPTLDKGLRLTALKKGGSYIEDDSKPYQHVTTAAGYGVVYCHNESKRVRISMGGR